MARTSAVPNQAAATDAPRSPFGGAEGSPVLAAKIELCGRLQGGGFAADQWLVQRDGRFLQLTELLYRIAEASNGWNTLTEIASNVSAATGRVISPDQVEQLLIRRLIPAGIIADAADASPQGPASFSRRGEASPLALNLKLAVVSPRVIDPCTRLLQVLYWPPVLLTLLVIALVAHGWLFFVQGVEGSVRDALLEPGRLLATLGLTILGAAFHEFGHASALRYGGGKVRGMGAGLYLVYPAFYTDVTDSYRLGKWARVRTDLGGFYFNLIFGMGLMAAYAVTGAEFLLLVVVVMSLDILRQSMPFVRMDGYWVLADLTGIPDLFTHVPAFVKSVWRSVLSLCGRSEPGRIRLKPWVAVTFALYILTTVPVLLYVLFLMVKTLPTVLTTAATSFEIFGEQLGGAVEQRDGIGAALAGTQLFILAMTLTGLLLMLGLVAHRLAGFLLNWGRQSVAQGVVSAFVTSALFVLVAHLWLPQLPGATSTLTSVAGLAGRAAVPGDTPAPATADGPVPSSDTLADGAALKTVSEPDLTMGLVLLSVSVLCLGLVLAALVRQLAQDRHAWTWRGELWRNTKALAGAGLVALVAFLPVQGTHEPSASRSNLGFEGTDAQILQMSPDAPASHLSPAPGS
jgi:putative peptide zinc metalloprotease protein